MARFARVVAVDVPHHVTQRGNARQVILNHDADRVAYLELLRQYSELHRLSLLGYCLMSNHVHLIVVPHTGEALAQTLKHTQIPGKTILFLLPSRQKMGNVPSVPGFPARISRRISSRISGFRISISVPGFRIGPPRSPWRSSMREFQRLKAH